MLQLIQLPHLGEAHREREGRVTRLESPGWGGHLGSQRLCPQVSPSSRMVQKTLESLAWGVEGHKMPHTSFRYGVMSAQRGHPGASFCRSEALVGLFSESD